MEDKKKWREWKSVHSVTSEWETIRKSRQRKQGKKMKTLTVARFERKKTRFVQMHYRRYKANEEEKQRSERGKDQQRKKAKSIPHKSSHLPNLPLHGFGHFYLRITFIFQILTATLMQPCPARSTNHWPSNALDLNSFGIVLCPLSCFNVCVVMWKVKLGTFSIWMRVCRWANVPMYKAPLPLFLSFSSRLFWVTFFSPLL